MIPYQIIRPILFSMDAEKAHDFTLGMLNKTQGFSLLNKLYPIQQHSVECLGMQFDNPVGLAAGLDKNADYIDALGALGFGFVEVGTITPKAQVGNDKPRMFRLPEQQAIINRMGFNNLGVDHLVANISKAKYQGKIGINIGKNAVTPVENAVDDYLHCLEKVYAHADYITLNISSPNTKNLRNLQSGDALTQLLSKVKDRHSQLATEYKNHVPLVLKIAPDLDEKQIEFIAHQLLSFEIDGLITTNTTISRDAVSNLTHGDEAGGLSGKPVRDSSTKILRSFSEILTDKVELIGVGGIDSGEVAVEKIEAGAKMVQLYSGMIYQGPKLIKECVNAIKQHQKPFI